MRIMVLLYAVACAAVYGTESREARANRSLPIVVTGRNYGDEHKRATPSPLLTVKKAKYKIVIIDTGYDPALAAAPIKVCAKGSYDFYDDAPQVARTVDHGSMVASIIADVLVDVDYCAVIYQVVDKKGTITPTTMARAFAMAQHEHPDAVNVSITGPMADQLEERLLTRLSESGTRIFVAAGNERNNFNYACSNYPACYHIPNMVVVGALTNDLQQPASYSNYGTKVKLWYPGVYEDGYRHAEGTSFAAPRALADYLLSLSSSLK